MHKKKSLIFNFAKRKKYVYQKKRRKKRNKQKMPKKNLKQVQEIKLINAKKS